MPIRPYIAPSSATRRMTCLIKTISATCDYMDWCNTECNTNRYLQLTPPLPRERSNSSETFNSRRENRPSRQLARKYALQHRWLKFKSYNAISVGAIYATYLTTSQPKDRSESSDPFWNVYYKAKDRPLKLTRKWIKLWESRLMAALISSWNSKTFSEETSIAKELVLLILRFWH